MESLLLWSIKPAVGSMPKVSDVLVAKYSELLLFKKPRAMTNMHIEITELLTCCSVNPKFFGYELEFYARFGFGFGFNSQTGIFFGFEFAFGFTIVLQIWIQVINIRNWF